MDKILFRRHYIQNADTKKKCRVWYSLDNRMDKKPCVTIYAKGHLDSMIGIIDFENNTDTMTDYFEKDRAVIFESHPQYEEARMFIESMKDPLIEKYKGY